MLSLPTALAPPLRLADQMKALAPTVHFNHYTPVFTPNLT